MANNNIQPNEAMETLKKVEGALVNSGLELTPLTEEDLLATQAKIDLIDEASFSKEEIRKRVSAKILDQVADAVITNEIKNTDEAIEAELRTIAQDDIPHLQKEMRIIEERINLLEGISEGKLTFRDLRAIISDGEHPSSKN